MAQAKVTSKGQITIPQEVRRRLGLTTGSRIDFVWTAAGGVALEVVSSSVADLAGVLHRTGRPIVSLEDMDEAVRGGAAESGEGGIRA